MRLYSFELAYYFGLSGVQEKYSFYTQYTQKIIIIEIQTFHVIPPTFKKSNFANWNNKFSSSSYETLEALKMPEQYLSPLNSPIELHETSPASVLSPLSELPTLPKSELHSPSQEDPLWMNAQVGIFFSKKPFPPELEIKWISLQVELEKTSSNDPNEDAKIEIRYEYSILG